MKIPAVNKIFVIFIMCIKESIIKYTFKYCILFLKGLVEVITSSDDHVSVRATILLGELLHMVSLGLVVCCRKDLVAPSLRLLDAFSSWDPVLGCL